MAVVSVLGTFYSKCCQHLFELGQLHVLMLVLDDYKFSSKSLPSQGAASSEQCEAIVSLLRQLVLLVLDDYMFSSKSLPSQGAASSEQCEAIVSLLRQLVLQQWSQVLSQKKRLNGSFDCSHSVWF
jgi:hypothetical protein